MSKAKIIFAVIVGFMCLVIFMPSDKPASIQEETKEEQVEVINVSAYQLYKEYQDNEIAADQKYENKTVKVSGIIDSIGKEITGKAYVVLKGSEYSMFGVQCVFPRNVDETDIALISKGESIAVKGVVSGYLISVIVNDCVLVKE